MTLLQEINRQYFSSVYNIFKEKNIGLSERPKVNYGSRNLEYLLRLQSSLDLDTILKLAEAIALESRASGVIAKRTPDGFVSIQISLPPELWKVYTRQQMTDLQIGFTDSNKAVSIKEGLPSMLFAGITGSGKTWGVYNFLLSAIKHYSPTELKFVVCDPHRQFERFEDDKRNFITFFNSVHIQTLAQSKEEIQHAIQWVYDELERRKESQYRTPRILLICDESDDIATMTPQVESNLTAIGKQGRKFGLSLLLISQRPQVSTIPMIDSLPIRYIGKLDIRQSEVTQLLGEKIRASQLTMEGDTIESFSQNNTRFAIPYLTENDFKFLERGEGYTEILTPSKEIVLSDSKVGRPSADWNFDLLALMQLQVGLPEEKRSSYRWLSKQLNMSNTTIKDHWQKAEHMVNRMNQLMNLKECAK